MAPLVSDSSETPTPKKEVDQEFLHTQTAEKVIDESDNQKATKVDQFFCSKESQCEASEQVESQIEASERVDMMLDQSHPVAESTKKDHEEVKCVSITTEDSTDAHTAMSSESEFSELVLEVGQKCIALESVGGQQYLAKILEIKQANHCDNEPQLCHSVPTGSKKRPPGHRASESPSKKGRVDGKESVRSDDVQETMLRIHFEGWNKNHDKWLPLSQIISGPPKPVQSKPPQCPEIIKVTPNSESCSASLEIRVLSKIEAGGNLLRLGWYQVEVNKELHAPVHWPNSWTLVDGYFHSTLNIAGLKAGMSSSLCIRVKEKDSRKNGKGTVAASPWSSWASTTVEIDEIKPKESEGEDTIGKRAAKAKAMQLVVKEAPQRRNREGAHEPAESHCALCYAPANSELSVRCSVLCRRSFHASCSNLDEEAVEDSYTCDLCVKEWRKCNGCDESGPSENMVVCGRPSCKKAYHPECLSTKYGLQVEVGQKLVCPQHACQAGCGHGSDSGAWTLIKCILCAEAFHRNCMPLNPDAVIELEGGRTYICAKHPTAQKTLRQRRRQLALSEQGDVDGPPAEPPTDPIFAPLFEALSDQFPVPFRLPLRFAAARNAECAKPAPFKLIKRNLYPAGCRPRMDKQDITVCSCRPERSALVCMSIPASLADTVPLGCGDYCVNRGTCVECLASVCPMGAQCGNQRLQRRYYAKLELFKTQGRGFGLRALEDIPCNALVQEYIGEIISTELFQERTARYGQETPVYFFNLDNDFVIDASAMGSMARFINHSCDPNCYTEKWTVGGETRIGIFATAPIPKGTEVTYNYQFESFGAMIHRCLCGAANCSGFLGKRPKSLKDMQADARRLAEAKALARKNKRRPAPSDPATGPEEAAGGTSAAGAAVGEKGGEGDDEATPAAGDVSGDPDSAAAAASETPATSGKGLSGAGPLVPGILVHGVPAATAADGCGEGREPDGAVEGAAAASSVGCSGRAWLGRVGRVEGEWVLVAFGHGGLCEWLPVTAVAPAVTPADDADPPQLCPPEYLLPPVALPDDLAPPPLASAEAGPDSVKVGKVGEAKRRSGGAGRAMEIKRLTEDRLGAVRAGTSPPELRVRCTLGAGDLTLLCGALRAGAGAVGAVRRLDLDGCGLGDGGAAEVGAMLKDALGILDLDLQWCNITDAGCADLAAALTERRRGLHSLNLGSNRLTDQVAAGPLARLARRWPTTTIVARDAGISPAGLAALAAWGVDRATAAAMAVGSRPVPASVTTAVEAGADVPPL